MRRWPGTVDDPKLSSSLYDHSKSITIQLKLKLKTTLLIHNTYIKKYFLPDNENKLIIIPCRGSVVISMAKFNHLVVYTSLGSKVGIESWKIPIQSLWKPTRHTKVNMILCVFSSYVNARVVTINETHLKLCHYFSNSPQRLLPLISTVTTATTSKSGSREPEPDLFFSLLFLKQNT